MEQNTDVKDNSSDSDLSETWSIIDKNGLEENDNCSDILKLQTETPQNDENISSYNDSDEESLEVIDEESSEERDTLVGGDCPDTESDCFSFVNENNDNISETVAERNLRLILKERRYIHQPNVLLNNRLNIILVLAVAVVVGLGFGHFLGTQEECSNAPHPYQNSFDVHHHLYKLQTTDISKDEKMDSQYDNKYEETVKVKTTLTPSGAPGKSYEKKHLKTNKDSYDFKYEDSGIGKSYRRGKNTELDQDEKQPTLSYMDIPKQHLQNSENSKEFEYRGSGIGESYKHSNSGQNKPKAYMLNQKHKKNREGPEEIKYKSSNIGESYRHSKYTKHYQNEPEPSSSYMDNQKHVENSEKTEDRKYRNSGIGESYRHSEYTKHDQDEPEPSLSYMNNQKHVENSEGTEEFKFKDSGIGESYRHSKYTKHDQNEPEPSSFYMGNQKHVENSEKTEDHKYRNSGIGESYRHSKYTKHDQDEPEPSLSYMNNQKHVENSEGTEEIKFKDSGIGESYMHSKYTKHDQNEPEPSSFYMDNQKHVENSEKTEDHKYRNSGVGESYRRSKYTKHDQDEPEPSLSYMNNQKHVKNSEGTEEFKFKDSGIGESYRHSKYTKHGQHLLKPTSSVMDNQNHIENIEDAEEFKYKGSDIGECYRHSKYIKHGQDERKSSVSYLGNQEHVENSEDIEKFKYRSSNNGENYRHSRYTKHSYKEAEPSLSSVKNQKHCENSDNSEEFKYIDSGIGESYRHNTYSKHGQDEPKLKKESVEISEDSNDFKYKNENYGHNKYSKDDLNGQEPNLSFNDNQKMHIPLEILGSNSEFSRDNVRKYRKYLDFMENLRIKHSDDGSDLNHLANEMTKHRRSFSDEEFVSESENMKLAKDSKEMYSDNDNSNADKAYEWKGKKQGKYLSDYKSYDSSNLDIQRNVHPSERLSNHDSYESDESVKFHHRPHLKKHYRHYFPHNHIHDHIQINFRDQSDIHKWNNLKKGKFNTKHSKTRYEDEMYVENGREERDESLEALYYKTYFTSPHNVPSSSNDKWDRKRKNMDDFHMESGDYSEKLESGAKKNRKVYAHSQDKRDWTRRMESGLDIDDNTSENKDSESFDEDYKKYMKKNLKHSDSYKKLHRKEPIKKKGKMNSPYDENWASYDKSNEMYDSDNNKKTFEREKPLEKEHDDLEDEVYVTDDNEHYELPVQEHRRSSGSEKMDTLKKNVLKEGERHDHNKYYKEEFSSDSLYDLKLHEKVTDRLHTLLLNTDVIDLPDKDISSLLHLAYDLDNSIAQLETLILSSKPSELLEKLKKSSQKIHETITKVKSDMDTGSFKMFDKIHKRLMKLKNKLHEKWCHLKSYYSNEKQFSNIFKWFNSGLLHDCPIVLNKHHERRGKKATIWNGKTDESNHNQPGKVKSDGHSTQESVQTSSDENFKKENQHFIGSKFKILDDPDIFKKVISKDDEILYNLQKNGNDIWWKPNEKGHLVVYNWTFNGVDVLKNETLSLLLLSNAFVESQLENTTDSSTTLDEHSEWYFLRAKEREHCRTSPYLEACGSKSVYESAWEHRMEESAINNDDSDRNNKFYKYRNRYNEFHNTHSGNDDMLNKYDSREGRSNEIKRCKEKMSNGRNRCDDSSKKGEDLHWKESDEFSGNSDYNDGKGCDKMCQKNINKLPNNRCASKIKPKLSSTVFKEIFPQPLQSSLKKWLEKSLSFLKRNIISHFPKRNRA